MEDVTVGGSVVVGDGVEHGTGIIVDAIVNQLGREKHHVFCGENCWKKRARDEPTATTSPPPFTPQKTPAGGKPSRPTFAGFSKISEACGTVATHRHTARVVPVGVSAAPPMSKG